MRSTFTVIFLLFLYSNTWGQLPDYFPKKDYDLSVIKSDSIVKIDGELNESIWRNAEIAKDFWQKFPSDTRLALTQTEVRMTYDDKYIYVAAICYQEKAKGFVATSLKRDFDFNTNDNFTIYIDPFKDGQNGFSFGVTPFGVQREGIMYGGELVDLAWDNKWTSDVKIYDDYWVAEMAIPFKSLRFKGNTTEWKMNFARNDFKRNETSVWVPVPITLRIASLAFTGTVKFSNPLQKTGANVAIIPYVAGKGSKDYIPNAAGEIPKAKSNFNAGFDAKIAVTSSLNLDLTTNPDFSQVEVDRQVTNLDRFEIFFPERRQFFIENSDLFGQFGFSRIRPFFSRRIGIGYDSTTSTIVQNRIVYGARLSGKVNKDWRLGVLNMQTADDEAAKIKGQNYSVFAIQRQVFARSNVAAILVNRQIFNDTTVNKYSRVAGIDYNLSSKDGRWSGKFFYHRAFTPEKKSDSHAHASYVNYRTKHISLNWNHEYIGANYNPNDIGYVLRRKLWRIEPSLNLFFYPNNGVVASHGPGYYMNIYTDLGFNVKDFYYESNYTVNFVNSAILTTYFGKNYVKLLNDFGPTNTRGELRLLKGTSYNTDISAIRFQSDTRKLFTYVLSTNYGGYYNGKKLTTSTELYYRIQPYGSFGLVVDYNDIRLPEGYNSTNFFIVGPRIDASFTRNIFLTTFLQYNSQTKNVNFNTRLQWRFKPVSDFFLVYTDNYFSDNLNVKNRAIVAKLTYWLNL